MKPDPSAKPSSTSPSEPWSSAGTSRLNAVAASITPAVKPSKVSRMSAFGRRKMSTATPPSPVASPGTISPKSVSASSGGQANRSARAPPDRRRRGRHALGRGGAWFELPKLPAWSSIIRWFSRPTPEFLYPHRPPHLVPGGGGRLRGRALLGCDARRGRELSSQRARGRRPGSAPPWPPRSRAPGGTRSGRPRPNPAALPGGRTGRPRPHPRRSLIPLGRVHADRLGISSVPCPRRVGGGSRVSRRDPAGRRVGRPRRLEDRREAQAGSPLGGARRAGDRHRGEQPPPLERDAGPTPAARRL
jgi:hypothetical protein